ncbi:hypothetical protein Y597_6116 [Burkholderia pseudomallei MSHR1000]|nr:hypothetical protein Y597_6116 [Burkholderia pseudomallei MSHR1000]
MVWPSRRHVTFFSNRPRALNHYTPRIPLICHPPRRTRFPQGLARRSAPGPFLAHRFGAETLAQRLRFPVSKSERHWVPTHTFRREGRSAPLGAIIGMSSMLASP